MQKAERDPARSDVVRPEFDRPSRRSHHEMARTSLFEGKRTRDALSNAQSGYQ
jgi:hypothetical protein